MRSVIALEFASSLDADPADVWAAVSTMQGVNFELHPFIHMSSPAAHRALPASIVPGQVIFRSWLLLFRVLPFDRHALALDQFDEGHGFVEESSSWLQRRWRHERRLATDAAGHCLVTDRLVIEPRVQLALPVVELVVKHLFRHRHRRLRRRFGPGAP